MGIPYFISPPDDPQPESSSSRLPEPESSSSRLPQPESSSSRLPTSISHVDSEECSCPICRGVIRTMEAEDIEGSSGEDLARVAFQAPSPPVTRAGRRPSIRRQTDSAQARQDELPEFVGADRLLGDTLQSRENRLRLELREAERDVQAAQVQMHTALQEFSQASLQWTNARRTMERMEARLNNVMAQLRSLHDEMRADIVRLAEMRRLWGDVPGGRRD